MKKIILFSFFIAANVATASSIADSLSKNNLPILLECGIGGQNGTINPPPPPPPNP